MYCKYCGKKIAEDSTFCKYCGKKISELNNEDDIEGKDATDSLKAKAEVLTTTGQGTPMKIETTYQPQKRNGTIANEIVANLKMIGASLLVIILYFVGFSYLHYNDKKALDETSYYGESCYDPSYISGSWELSWERKYYTKIYATKPYSQWSKIEKKMEMVLEYTNIGLALSINFEPEEALSRADEMAKSKGLPTSIIDRLKEEAKKEAEKDRIDFNSTITGYRISGYNDDLRNGITLCTIISLTFFVVGRYIIKFCQWVKNNNME